MYDTEHLYPLFVFVVAGACATAVVCNDSAVGVPVLGSNRVVALSSEMGDVDTSVLTCVSYSTVQCCCGGAVASPATRVGAPPSRLRPSRLCVLLAVSFNAHNMFLVSCKNRHYFA